MYQKNPLLESKSFTKKVITDSIVLDDIDMKYPNFSNGCARIDDIISKVGNSDLHSSKHVARGETYIRVYLGEPTKDKYGFSVYKNQALSNASQFGLLGRRNGPCGYDCSIDNVEIAIKALIEWLEKNGMKTHE